MPRRNLNLIMLAAFVSLICYHRAARTRYASVFADAVNQIQTNYVEPIEQRRLFDAAMDGMMSELDPYSQYIDPETLAQFNADIDQQFGGIGVEVSIDPETERLMIVSPLPGTPAYEAGAVAGDIILAVDGESTEGWELRDAVGVMRGKPGTEVVITVLHEGEEEPVDLTIERAIIEIESVLGDRRKADGSWDFTLEEYPDIGYVRIVNFGKHTAEELRDVLRDLQSDGIKGLILDVRGNPGGLLDVAVDVCDMFIDEGVVVTTRGRGGKLLETYSASKSGTVVRRSLPIAVLVDESSASASEIFAACLQDYERAVVVGERTWGKGTVQNITDLEAGRSALKLTVATYWRPSGKNIHRLSEDREAGGEWGVRPDPGMEVELDEEALRELYRWQRERAAMPTGEGDDDEPSADGADGEDGGEDQARPDPVLKRALKYLHKKINDEA